MKKSKEIKKLFMKIFFLILPFILYIILELFILPIDFYNFRVWEALIIKSDLVHVSGMFYPERRIHTVEYGDLAHHTKYSIPKEVYWETDKYGFRKKNIEAHPDIVIVGDSNIVGSSLTQNAILSEVLEKETGFITYPYAPFEINNFISDKRFIDDPPKIVVFARVERGLRYLPELNKNMSNIRNDRFMNLFNNNDHAKELLILYDRFSKRALINYIKARIKDLNNKVEAKYYYGNEPIFFTSGAEINHMELTEKEINDIVRRLKEYNVHFKELGITFIFLPIPNKANIYYEAIPGSNKPTSLGLLIESLRDNGIYVADTQTAFNLAFEKGCNLYHFDDTHWNANGVQVAAVLLKDMIFKARF